MYGPAEININFPTTLPVWFGEEMAPNTDMWATSDETRSSIVVAYRSACEHADDTISSTAPNTIADTPWLGPGPMSLHRVLVHVLAETERHAGHADLVRELIDGAVGRQPGNAQMLPGSLADDRTAEWLTQYRTQVEQAARSAGQRAT